jgi:hypothetical protein
MVASRVLMTPDGVVRLRCNGPQRPCVVHWRTTQQTERTEGPAFYEQVLAQCVSYTLGWTSVVPFLAWQQQLSM